MDDPAVFAAFVTNMLRVGVARVQNEIINFTDTFSDLLSNSEKDIDDFVTITHGSNSARANNAKILIPSATVTALKAILFELKDRQLCNSLPDLATLQAIDIASLRVLRSMRNEAVQLAKLENNTGPSTTMTVVKLTERNYQDFETSF